jgi:DNA/RNA endonuclease G (NUC1)
MSRFLQVCLLVLSFDLSYSWARIGANYQLELGNPSSATSESGNKKNFLIKRDEYAESYNNETEEPNWVSWSLTKEDTGHSGRSKDFFVDTTLPSGFVQVTTETFSGYDRGHMCPSGDRTVTREHNDKTFLMSNMVPQAADNNRGPWEQFESYCRDLAFHGDEVLIICGPSCFRGSASHGVAIPKYTWKIAVTRKPGGSITSSSRVIAIKMPNKNGIKNTVWTDYITSVAEIEKDTGYKFFDTLTASTASTLKVVVDKEATGGRKGGSEKETAVATTEEPKATSTSSTQAPIQLVATQAAPVVETPAPVVLPDGPSLIVYRKKTDGPIETRTANVKRSKEVVEVTKEDGALLILNSNLVLAILPLPPKEEVKMSSEQIDLALSKYDEAEKDGSIKELLQEGHAKWTALKTPAVVEAPVAPVVANVQPPKESELDVPTAAGVEEPELPVWRVWYEKARDWIGKYLH